MRARAIAIHGYEMSRERRANLEIKSECPALPFTSLFLFGTDASFETREKYAWKVSVQVISNYRL